MDGMANVISKRCPHPNCSKAPSYGTAGSKKAEICAEHPWGGMVNQRSQQEMWPPPMLNPPAYGKAGSNKEEVCTKHALDRMVNVVNKRCCHPS